MQSDHTLISCREAEAYLHLFVEAELDQLRSVRLKDHLTACDSCRTLESELASEQLWLIENAVRAPTLSANFASKVSAEIRREGLHRSAFSIWLRKTGPWPGLAAAGILLALLVFTGRDSLTTRDPATDLASADGALPVVPAVIRATDFTEVPSPIGAPSTIGKSLVTLSEPAGRIGSEKNAGLKLTATAPEVSTAREPITILTAGLNQLDMGKLFGLFARRYEKARLPTAKPIDPDDPCLDDLNDDGKVDGGDVAYGCLLLLETKPSAPERDSTKSGEAPDCDNRDPCV
tara:strand:- start:1006 stop:1875 length:870 start_codon:yes stop_codon:yes gene_type:complete